LTQDRWFAKVQTIKENKDLSESKHNVICFDPNRHPALSDLLTREQAKDSTVMAVVGEQNLGIVETPAGTFAVDSHGNSPLKPVKKVQVYFYRERKEGREAQPFEVVSFSFDEVKALQTGLKPLDEFVPPNKYPALENQFSRVGRVGRKP
jgi:hypothetical protein